MGGMTNPPRDPNTPRPPPPVGQGGQSTSTLYQCLYCSRLRAAESAIAGRTCEGCGATKLIVHCKRGDPKRTAKPGQAIQ